VLSLLLLLPDGLLLLLLKFLLISLYLQLNLVSLLLFGLDAHVVFVFFFYLVHFNLVLDHLFDFFPLLLFYPTDRLHFLFYH